MASKYKSPIMVLIPLGSLWELKCDVFSKLVLSVSFSLRYSTKLVEVD